MENKLELPSPSLLDQVKSFATVPHLLLGLVVVGLFIFLGVVLYRYQIKKKTSEEDEEDDDGEKTCEVFYFYTTWCPMCKKTRPEWDKFAAQWNGKMKDGTTIITVEVDCDQNEALANKYQVKAYPTVICAMNGKKTELEANPTAETLNHFLDSCFS